MICIFCAKTPPDSRVICVQSRVTGIMLCNECLEMFIRSYPVAVEHFSMLQKPEEPKENICEWKQ